MEHMAPYSLTCRICSAPERSDVPTRMLLLFESNNSSALSDISGRALRKPSGRQSSDFVSEQRLRVVQPMRDHAAADVWVKKSCVQHEKLNQTRKTQLPSFEDDVTVMKVIEEFLLGPVRAEWNLPTVLPQDRVEVA